MDERPIVTKYLDLSTGAIDFSKFKIDFDNYVHPFLVTEGEGTWLDSAVVKAEVFGRYMRLEIKTPKDLTDWVVIPVFRAPRCEAGEVAFDDEPGWISVRHYRVQPKDGS